jgi:Beta-ketoacyl synthase, C-terminal domain
MLFELWACFDKFCFSQLALRPSASAQANLIRACYSRVGLDLANPDDRPQYFEAHGTGTPVGKHTQEKTSDYIPISAQLN